MRSRHTSPAGRDLIATAFLLPVAYVPVFVQVALTPKLILLSVMVPLMLARRETPGWTWPHIICALFLGWGALTLTWTSTPYDGLLRLWEFILIGGAFHIGHATDWLLLRRTLLAFAAGVLVSLPVAAGQWLLAWPGHVGEWPQTVAAATQAWLGSGSIWKDGIWQAGLAGGLFGNPNHLGEAAVLALAGISWLPWAPWLLFGGALALLAAASLSKSAGLTAWWLACLLVLRWRSWAFLGLLAAGVAAAGWYVWVMGLGDARIEPRLALYLNSLAMITVIGKGLGSYWAEYSLGAMAWWPSPETIFGFAIRPQNAHNDLLTIAVEMGIVGTALAVAFVAAVLKNYGNTTARIVFLTFLFMSMWNFPLYSYTPAFVAFLCAGHLCRSPS